MVDIVGKVDVGVGLVDMGGTFELGGGVDVRDGCLRYGWLIS